MRQTRVNGSEKSTKHLPVTVDGQSGELVPQPPKKINLHNLDAVRREMGKVYRLMRQGMLEPSTGTKLVYTLSSIGDLMQLCDLEKRLAALERQRTVPSATD